MTARDPLGIPVVRARKLVSVRAAGPEPGWSFSNLIGRLSELSEEGPAGALTVTATVISEAQRAGEAVVWIAGVPTIFYPPDFVENEVDLAALTVVWAESAPRAILAADWLLRAGTFGLLVLDLGEGPRTQDADLGRLARLAEKNTGALLFLTGKSAGVASQGSMISLRGAVRRVGAAGDPFASEIEIIKDRRSSPGAKIRMQYDGPRGMC